MKCIRIQGLENPVFGAGCPGGAASLFSVMSALNPLVYFPLNELAGTAAINYGSLGVAANGLHNGSVVPNSIDGPGGMRAPYYNGALSFTTVLSAPLIAAFNGNEITVVLFSKVFNAGVLTDGNYHTENVLVSDANNFHQFRKTSTNNDFIGYHVAGGVADSVSYTVSDANWHMQAYTGSDSGDAMKLYLDNAQSGATQTGIGTWVNALVAAYLGCNASAILKWYGYLSNYAIYLSVLSLAQLQTIYAASGI